MNDPLARFVAALEQLLKLLADRTQDRADIEAIVAAQTGTLDLALLEHEAATLELELPSELRRPR
jgi:hypothetical protein